MQIHRTIIAPAVSDPFGQFGGRAARRHPRRDPDGHPNPNPAPVPDPEPKPDPAPVPGADDWADTFAGMTPAEVKKKLEDSRKWEDRSKANHPKAEKYDALMATLNPEGAAAPPDPATLATDLTAAQRETAATKSENLRLQFAIDNGVPKEWINRLRGDTADELLADWESLQPSLAPAVPKVGSFVPGEGHTPATPPSISAQITAAEAAGEGAKAMALKSQQLAELSRK